MRREAVLVIDDEPDIAALIVALLESEGYRCVCASSGEEGLGIAARSQPAAVVLDLSLPDLDGLHVLRLLKSHAETAAIPVVVVSAYTARMTASDRSLTYAVFEKPFDLDDLASTIAQATRERAVAVSRHPSRQRRVAASAVPAAVQLSTSIQPS